jgi:peroxiredoxin
MEKLREQFKKETGIDPIRVITTNDCGVYIDWLEKQVEGLSGLVLSLNEGVMKSTLALEVVNEKVKEQAATIMKLNNGIVKAVQINNVKRKLN